MPSSPEILSVSVNKQVLKKMAKWGFALIAVLAFLAILPLIKSVVTIVIIALFLAFLFDPVVNFIENQGLDRLVAVIIVFGIIVLMTLLVIEFLAPIVMNEVHQISSGLREQSPGQVIQQLKEKLGDKLPVLKSPMIQKELQSIVDSLMKKGFNIVIGVFSTIISLIMLAFITFFFLKDGRRMKKTLVSWVPNRYFEMTLLILHKTSTRLGRYIRGQLLVAAIVGTLSILALYLLNIRYFFFIGSIAGLANMIPYFGPIVGAVPAIVIALIDTGSFGAVVVVIVAFAGIQLFENIFVSPVIVSKSVELHPLTIIIAILIGGQLLGIFGMLLAVPTASIIKVTAKELLWGFKNYRI